MDAWRDIRLVARKRHIEALKLAGGKRHAESLLAAALKSGNLIKAPFAPGTKAGKGVLGFLDRPGLIVNVATGQDKPDEAVVIAHELGHFYLHLDPMHDVTVIAPGLSGDMIETGVGAVQGYSSHERTEVQADVFAGEFLCPADWLHDQLRSGRRPTEIATELGLPPTIVVNQAIRALLLPPLRDPPSVPEGQTIDLDASQLDAAIWSDGPLLVDAGPGTGKTRTLIHRIRHLLAEGASPTAILALTFSNKSAEEMRERIAVAEPQAAIEMWIGTFHAFGLELVSKYAPRIGRTDRMKILDHTGTLTLLESRLSVLPLRQFQNLYEPAFELTNVLRAISRCKDEMLSPDEYETAAREFADVAAPDQVENAEKALEVAAIYRIYQEALKEADSVDFGDLVMQAALLIEDNPDIAAEYQGRFKHVLVDEYQDVNLASARLLRALSAADTDVWVVADQRQSIYRFRGAEPSNVVRFEAAFSGSRRSLKFNYRSGQPVVTAFERFGSTMRTGNGGTWTASRGEVGRVSRVVADTIVSEAAAIRDRIEELRGLGVPYDDQIVLGRSHLTLSRICEELERLGVPLLYMGDLFERPEIRDLLSLIAIDAEFGGIGLVRVAAMPEYGVPRPDALTIISWCKANRYDVFDALRQIDQVPALSDKGRVGLTLLSSHLAGMDRRTSPWTLLTTWLLERSNYLQPLLEAGDPKSRQNLIAIYQLLKVCSEHAATGNPSRRLLLTRIRHIEALNEDKPFRAVSSEASDMSAVRVMTIHASKGLEFRAVHLPGLATRYTPANRQSIRCPPPPSLARLAVQPNDHEAEEECLFFVALSRAKDYLCLTRAERYTTQKASPSKFLDDLGAAASTEARARSVNVVAPPEILMPPTRHDAYEEQALRVYLKCPSRYQYEAIDDLRGRSGDSAYVDFHRCVYRTIGWLEAEREQGRHHDRDSAIAQLDIDWQANGPVRHGFAQYYRDIADNMVAVMAAVIAAEDGRYAREEWKIDVGGKLVAVTPDRVFIDARGHVHVQRVRTGRKTKSESGNAIYALLRRGASDHHPGRPILVETFYPATRETAPTDDTRDAEKIADYRQAIASIEMGRFPPDPGRHCPGCQCYFICGA